MARARRLGIAAILLLTCACSETIDYAAEDDAKCRAYGDPSSAAYLSCRRTLQRDRQLGTLLQSPAVRPTALPVPVGSRDGK